MHLLFVVGIADIVICSAFLLFWRVISVDEYMTIKAAAQKWGIGERRINTLCAEGRIDGAVKFGNSWAIPSGAAKPADRRIRSGKYIKLNGKTDQSE